MPILTSEEQNLKMKRKQEIMGAITQFRKQYISSMLWGLKIGGISLGTVIVLYFLAKLIVRWDLFYETDLDYDLVFLTFAGICLFIVIICIVVAVILFNTKHKRKTKYQKKT